MLTINLLTAGSSSTTRMQPLSTGSLVRGVCFHPPST